MDNSVHIYPVEDSKTHEFNPKCHCQPSAVEEEGRPTYYHNPYDLRDFFNQDMNEIDAMYVYYTGRKPAWGRGGRC